MKGQIHKKLVNYVDGMDTIIHEINGLVFGFIVYVFVFLSCHENFASDSCSTI